MLGLVSATSVCALELVSVNHEGTDSGNGSSSYSKISADGRFVVFTSSSDDLVSMDSNGRPDVFVRNLKNGTTTLVSINQAGTNSGNGLSNSPSISADGRFVVFASSADNLVSINTNNYSNVYLRDLQNGTTTLVSVNKDGNPSRGYSFTNPKISASGQFVTFESGATDLVNIDGDVYWDVFVRDLQNGITSLVSVNKDGTGYGNLDSDWATISADGRFVAFESFSTDLVSVDTNNYTDVFVRDLHSGTTKLVTINKEGSDSGSGGSFNSAISADGRFVAFVSEADDLVSMDSNGKMDVFVRDLQSETTTLVSVNHEGTGSGNSTSGSRYPYNRYPFSLDISADGRFVTFSSYADNLVPMAINRNYNVFVRDLQNETTTLVSANKDGTNSGNAHSIWPRISADGRFVVFSSMANDLVSRDSNSKSDVFVRDLQSGTTTLASVNREGNDSANNDSYPHAISQDGRFVTFESIANDLVVTDTNGQSDIFVFEMGLPKSLTFDAPRVNAGDEMEGIVTLNAPAPTGGTLISLRSTKPNVAAVPNSLMIPAGSDFGRFVVSTTSETCSTRVGILATKSNTTVSKYLDVDSEHAIAPKPRGFNKMSRGERLSLYWNAMPDVDQFIIDRKRTNRSWKNIGELDGGQRFFIPPPQIPCVGYQYRLRAVNQYCRPSAAAYIGHLYDDGSCPF
jgi:hypothetical protein